MNILVIEEKITKLKELNISLQPFRKEYNLSLYLPYEISEKYILGEGNYEIKADEVYHLSMILPLILLKMIPVIQIHRSFQCLCLHNQYLRLLMQLDISENELRLVDEIMKQHHILYYEMYGHLVPKHHYRFHFSEFIRLLGAPRVFSSLRFESFHQIIKNVCSNTNNVNNSKLILYRMMKQEYKPSKNEHLKFFTIPYKKIPFIANQFSGLENCSKRSLTFSE